MDSIQLLNALQDLVERGCLAHSGIHSNKDLGHMIWNARAELERLRAAKPAFDLVAHLHRQKLFSETTFGPGQRTAGVIAHIRKELAEVEANPADITEWVDVILLALDGAWRAGYTPNDIAWAISAKQAENELRKWPDWRTCSPDAAIEHMRES